MKVIHRWLVLDSFACASAGSIDATTLCLLLFVFRLEEVRFMDPGSDKLSLDFVPMLFLDSPCNIDTCVQDRILRLDKPYCNPSCTVFLSQRFFVPYV
jgi:hypothetical protein